MEVGEFLIDEDSTIIDAMEQLSRVAKKILFVANNRELVAAITDGDIRRWILKKGKLEAKVKEVANYEPKYLLEDEKGKAKEFMKLYSIEALPIIDDNKNIVAITLWNSEEFEVKKTLNIPVVIMAGGLGKRLYPYTKILPKPLIPIGEIPIVEHIINRFNRLISDQFYLILNHKRNMIKAYFNDIDKAYELDYISEEQPLGTAGGLGLLRGKINSTFILSNCDILIEEDYKKIYNYHKKENNLITMVCSLKNIKIPYGVIEINEIGKIEKMKEKPEMSFFTNTGMYVVEPKIIKDIEANKVIDFPDIIEGYLSKGEKIGVYPISENSWLDMGELEQLQDMKKRLKID